MCKAQWELQDRDLFTPSPSPLQLFATHTHKYLPGHIFLFVFVERLGLGGKWYHWKYSGMSRLHLGFCTANLHFWNELFLCTFTAASTAVSCIYYTPNEYLSIDFVQVCDSINILWKMRSLSTKRVRIPSPRKTKQKPKQTKKPHSGGWSLA